MTTALSGVRAKYAITSAPVFMPLTSCSEVIIFLVSAFRVRRVLDAFDITAGRAFLSVSGGRDASECISRRCKRLPGAPRRVHSPVPSVRVHAQSRVSSAGAMCGGRTGSRSKGAYSSSLYVKSWSERCGVWRDACSCALTNSMKYSALGVCLGAPPRLAGASWRDMLFCPNSDFVLNLHVVIYETKIRCAQVPGK